MFVWKSAQKSPPGYSLAKSSKIWEPARPLQRSLGPFGPEMPKNVSKMPPGASGPGAPKSLQKVSGTVWEVSGESPESVERVFSDCSRDFLETFRGSGAGDPGRHFRDFFGISGPKGPRDLCKGRAGSQSKSHILRNNRKGGTASLRWRTCVKRNTVFGARFKGLSLCFLYQTGSLICIKTGLDTYLIRIQTRTPLSRYPPRRRVNREVQTVNWEAGQEGAVETGVKRGLKRRINRELEAKISHKL